jgi:hypothetical protein
MFARPFSTAEQIRQDIGQQVAGGGEYYQTYGQAQFQTRPELLRADLMTSLATQMQQARKVGITGPATELTEEEQTGLKEAIGVGESTISDNIEATRGLSTEISGLQESITALQKTMNDLREVTDSDRVARGFRTREQTEQQMNDLVMQKARASEQLDAMTTSTGMAAERLGVLQGAMPASGLARFGGRAMGVAAGVAPLMMAVGQLPRAFRRSAAARAAMGNFGARAALGGDVERMIAAEELGGIEAVRGGAGFEAALNVGGQIGMAGISGIGAVVGGGPSTPLGIAGMAGAGYYGTQAVRGVADFSSAQRAAVESRIGAEQERQAELFQFTRAGRGAGIGAFQQALGTGGAEFTPFMLGNQRNVPMMGAGGALPGPAAQNMRRLAAYYGVGNRFEETTGQLAAGMGGNFMQEVGTRLGMDPNIAMSAFQMQAAGLSDAPGLMGQMFQGARPNDPQGRREATEQLKTTFEDAVAAGLDKARAGQALQFMAVQAQAGLGAAGAAEVGFRQQLGVAQNLFGGSGIEGQEMAFTQRTMTNMLQAGRAGGGIAGLARLSAAQDINRRFFKGRLSPAGIALLQQNVEDPAGLERIAKDLKVDIDGQAVSAEMQAQTITEQGRLAEMAVPGDPYARALVASQTGQTGTVGGGLAAADITRTQIVRGVERGEGAARPEQFPEVFGPLQRPTVGGMAEAARGTEAAQMAIRMQQVEAEKIVTGLNTLGNRQLPAINKAFGELIERANEVLAGGAQQKTIADIAGSGALEKIMSQGGGRSAPPKE